MRLFFSYLRPKLPGAALFAVLFALLAAVFLLYGLPPAAVGYAAVLCAFVVGAFCAAGFIRFSRRHKRLAALAEKPALTEAALPEPQNALERDYQALAEALRRENARERGESRRRFENMMAYYTLWAHQIKTPIAAMELILNREETGRTEDAAELREQLFRIERYVEMVLGYLRLDSDTTDLVLARYELDGVVRQAVRKYASLFIRRRIRLDYDALNVRVLTDEKWLLFAVEQVLSNALKYTPPGGTVSVYMEGESTLVIRDTGIGIRPEDLPRIFEKGFTGFNGREDKRSTGIGLYLTKRVCAMLGHTVAIESAPGQGTAVRLGLASAALPVE